MQGVAGVVVANTNMVTIDTATGQLGSQVVPTGVADIRFLQADDGNQAAPTVGGVVFVEGGTNINPTSPIANTLIINLDDNISLVSVTTSGNIVSTAGDIAAGGNLLAAGNLSVGGGVLFSAFGAGMLVSNSTGTISSINAAAGGIPISQGAGNQPQWGTLTSTGGTVAITNPSATTINLEVVGGTTPPAANCSFMAINGSVQTITGGIAVKINMPSVVYNNGLNYTGGTSSFTAPATGLYYFCYSIGVCGAPPKSGQIFLRKNGTAFTQSIWTNVTASSIMQTNSVVLDLIAGDVMDLAGLKILNDWTVESGFSGPYQSYWCGYRLT
jgi:hypothetical protein